MTLDQADGAAAYPATAPFINVTLAFNRAGRAAGSSKASGRGNRIDGGTATRLVNTLVVGQGDRCFGYDSLGTSLGRNLDSGATCRFAAPGGLGNARPNRERLTAYVALPNAAVRSATSYERSELRRYRC